LSLQKCLDELVESSMKCPRCDDLKRRILMAPPDGQRCCTGIQVCGTPFHVRLTPIGSFLRPRTRHCVRELGLSNGGPRGFHLPNRNSDSCSCVCGHLPPAPLPAQAMPDTPPGFTLSTKLARVCCSIALVPEPALCHSFSCWGAIRRSARVGSHRAFLSPFVGAVLCFCPSVCLRLAWPRPRVLPG